MEEHKTKERNFEQYLSTLLIIVFVASSVVILFYIWHFGTVISKDHSAWAEFGDFFGGTAGPLISFFAFFALLLTITLQNKAIEISKKELTLTRKELEKTSESAAMQAKHFVTEAKINDLIASIKQVEGTIYTKAGNTLPIFDDRVSGARGEPLEKFLTKNMELVSHWSAAEKDLVDSTELRPEEIGDLFKLLFDQLMLLREIPEARNRYRVLMHKHLETFFLLEQVAALPFDWKTPLDIESKDWIRIYEDNFRKYRIRNTKSTGP